MHAVDPKLVLDGQENPAGTLVAGTPLGHRKPEPLGSPAARPRTAHRPVAVPLRLRLRPALIFCRTVLIQVHRAFSAAAEWRRLSGMTDAALAREGLERRRIAEDLRTRFYGD